MSLKDFFKMERSEPKVYVRTTNRNYVINIFLSIFIAGICILLSYNIFKEGFIKKDNLTIPLIILLFYFIFIRAYRAIEYVLTRKSILSTGIWWKGAEVEGKEARNEFYWNIGMIIFFIILAIYYI